MTGIDHLTRELADMPSGVAYAAHAHAHYRKNPDFPISGDAIAHMRAERPRMRAEVTRARGELAKARAEIAKLRSELHDIGGADCD